ncbi:hypothetical protein QYF36_016493 [Acer negundo]|nr:hypothetical protein QYF36_016493 [Acer negundo]
MIFDPETWDRFWIKVLMLSIRQATHPVLPVKGLLGDADLMSQIQINLFAIALMDHRRIPPAPYMVFAQDMIEKLNDVVIQ